MIFFCSCSANIKLEDLFAYSETKAKYATEKIMKRKGFKEAIVQIESALNGEDPSPIAVSWERESMVARLENKLFQKVELDMNDVELRYLGQIL